MISIIMHTHTSAHTQSHTYIRIDTHTCVPNTRGSREEEAGQCFRRELYARENPNKQRDFADDGSMVGSTDKCAYPSEIRRLRRYIERDLISDR